MSVPRGYILIFVERGRLRAIRGTAVVCARRRISELCSRQVFFDRGEYLVVSRRRRDDALDPLDSVL